MLVTRSGIDVSRFSPMLRSFMKAEMIGRPPKDCSHIAWLGARVGVRMRARARARMTARVRVRTLIQRFRVRCARCVRLLSEDLSLLDAAPALRRHQRLELRPHRRREDLRDGHVALACAQRPPARVSARLRPAVGRCAGCGTAMLGPC